MSLPMKQQLFWVKAGNAGKQSWQEYVQRESESLSEKGWSLISVTRGQYAKREWKFK
jgi:hypothetical protein